MLKEEFNSEGDLIHYAVLALIESNGKYLLVDRATFPFGYALVTGHVEEGENEEEALIREVREETGLDVVKHKLVFRGRMGNTQCNKRAKIHESFIFKCEVEGDVKLNKKENKNWGWFSKEDMGKMGLGSYWKRILIEAGIL